MRRALTFWLVIALGGCSSAPKTPTASGGDSLPPREFVGSPSAVEREAPTGNLAARPLGMLAGQVVDADGRRVANATIQVLEDDGGRGRARLSVNTDRNGYFDIPGLEKGRRYALVASIDRTGGGVTGRTSVVASNVRVAIYLTETRSGPEATAAPPPAAAVSPPAITTEPARTAAGERRDFESTPSAPAAVPGPGREPDDSPSRKPLIPPPPITPETGVTTPLAGATTAAVPGPRPERETPSVRVVPACVRRGERVQELALNDSAGQPWELSEKQTGKLVLLDFWKVNCAPCRAALPKLTGLQAKYGPQGLQVIGVLCDRGTRHQRNESIASLASKSGVTINYPMLFSEEGDCPVRRHMEVFMYPTLILLDESGRIVWKNVGHTPESADELELKIKRMLAKP